MTPVRVAMLTSQTAVEWYGPGSHTLRNALITAADAFRRAQMFDPSHADTLYRRGEFAQDRHDLEEAAYWFRRALTSEPLHAGARRRLDALPPIPGGRQPGGPQDRAQRPAAV